MKLTMRNAAPTHGSLSADLLKEASREKLVPPPELPVLPGILGGVMLRTSLEDRSVRRAIPPAFLSLGPRVL
jgi:hypothetical protein